MLKFANFVLGLSGVYHVPKCVDFSLVENSRKSAHSDIDYTECSQKTKMNLSEQWLCDCESRLVSHSRVDFESRSHKCASSHCDSSDICVTVTQSRLQQPVSWWTFSKVCSLLNVIYKITTELAFEKFYQIYHMLQCDCVTWVTVTCVTGTRGTQSLCQ